MYSIGSRHRRSLGEAPLPDDHSFLAGKLSRRSRKQDGPRAMLPRPDAVGDTTCRAPPYRDEQEAGVDYVYPGW